MSAHDLLVRTRNATADVGFDVHAYGFYAEDCGSPRCILGWLGTFSGAERLSADCLYDHSDPAYLGALTALHAVAPDRLGDPEQDSLAEEVEADAFRVVQGTEGRFEQTDAVLPWLDRAIALTAPYPEVENEGVEAVPAQEARLPVGA